MQWFANPYLFPLLVAGIIGFLNVLFISRRLKVTGALPLLGMGVAVTQWAFAYYFLTNPKELIGRAVISAFEKRPELIHLCSQENTIRSEVVISRGEREPLHFDSRISNIRWKKDYSMGVSLC